MTETADSTPSSLRSIGRSTHARTALARLPEKLPRVGEGDPTGATYLLRYRGRTYAARQGAVPAVLRAAVATLDSIADGAGRSGRVHHVKQAPAAA